MEVNRRRSGAVVTKNIYLEGPQNPPGHLIMIPPQNLCLLKTGRATIQVTMACPVARLGTSRSVGMLLIVARPRLALAGFFAGKQNLIDHSFDALDKGFFAAFFAPWCLSSILICSTAEFF